MEGIERSQNVGNREGGDKAQLVALGGRTGGDPGQIHRLEVVAPVGPKVVSQFKAGGMHKGHIRVLGRDVKRRVQITKALGEDDLGPLLDHVFHHALGVGALRHIFRFDQLDIGQIFVHGDQTGMLRLVVAGIVHRADVQRADD